MSMSHSCHNKSFIKVMKSIEVGMNDRVFKFLWWIVVLVSLLGVSLEIAFARRFSVTFVLGALSVITILIVERRRRERKTRDTFINLKRKLPKSPK